jgi:hypothetical protein
LTELFQDRLFDAHFLEINARVVDDLVDDGLVDASNRCVRHDGEMDK